MIKELKKTYELLPKQPGESKRHLRVSEQIWDGFEIILEIFFTDKPKLGAAYDVTYEELRSVKFNYEDYAIDHLCAVLKNHLGEETT